MRKRISIVLVCFIVLSGCGGTEKTARAGLRDIASSTAGSIFLAAEKGVLFYAFDTLAYPKERVDLVVQLQSTRDMKGIVGVTVDFRLGKKLLGSAKTDKDGRATLSWTPPAEGNYKLTAKPSAVPDDAANAILDVTPAPLLVAARPKKTKFVVIDLDHTVVASSFFRVLIGGAKPMADSVDVTKKIAKKYGIIYLTHRPDLLTSKSKSWLSEKGYPPGPLLVSKLKEAFGDSGKFKTARLKAVRKSFPNVGIGIGDKLSDAQSYVDNGMTTYLIPHYKQKPKDMRKMADKVAKLRGRGLLNVVDGWREIEAGFFRDKKFSPDEYVRRLRARADQLEAEKKKDDDDD